MTAPATPTPVPLHESPLADPAAAIRSRVEADRARRIREEHLASGRVWEQRHQLDPADAAYRGLAPMGVAS